MKTSVFVAALCFGAINLLAQPNNSPAKSEGNSAGTPKATSTPERNGISAKNAESTKGGSPNGYASSEWILVYIAALTGLTIAYQAREMKRATEVMRDQSHHMVNTERAWIMVEIGEIPNWQPDPNQVQFLWIRPTVKNCGNTMARIKTIRAVVRLVPDGEKLPERPEYPVGQGVDVRGINLMVTPNFPIQPMKLGISGEEFIEVRRTDKFLYIHGFIEYSDTMSPVERRTAFCFYYAVQSGFSPDPTRFYLELTAPTGYNDWT